MAKRVNYIDIASRNFLQGEQLFNRYLSVVITIVDEKGNPKKKLQLVKVKGDVSVTGTLGLAGVNASVKGKVVLYTSLAGYDNNTSLLYQIKEILDKVKTTKNSSTTAYVRMQVFFGYMAMPSFIYGFEGSVFRVTSERNMSVKSQAWTFDFYDSDVFNDSINLIYKKPNKTYYAQGIKYKVKNPETGKTEAVESEGATYLQVLKDIYTPNGSDLSKLDDLTYSTKLSPELEKILDVQIVNNDLRKGIYELDYAKTSPRITKGKTNGSFDDLLRSFWINVKQDLKLKDFSIIVDFKPGSARGTSKAFLTLSDTALSKKQYSYLDDSKIVGLPTVAAAYIEVNTIFDPSVFYRDGILIKSRYFNILTVPDNSKLITEEDNVIINRILSSQQESNNLPVWYIVSYTIEFSNYNTDPSMMILSLSNDKIAVNIGV